MNTSKPVSKYTPTKIQGYLDGRGTFFETSNEAELSNVSYEMREQLRRLVEYCEENESGDMEEEIMLWLKENVELIKEFASLS